MMRFYEIPKLKSAQLRDDDFVVLSVDVGNTTIKSCVTATRFSDARMYMVRKDVSYTRYVDGGDDFETVLGRGLSVEGLKKEIKRSATRATFDIGKERVDLAVTCSGLTASFHDREKLDRFLQILPRAIDEEGYRIIGQVQSDQNREELNRYRYRVGKDGIFGGIGSRYPTGNYMEGLLASLGIKSVMGEAGFAKFRGGAFIDMGTTLSGVVLDKEPVNPAKVNVVYVGLAGGIFDVISQGFFKEEVSALDHGADPESVKGWVEDVMGYIDVKVVKGESWGRVPVFQDQREDEIIVGCDVGKDGSDLERLYELGEELRNEMNVNELYGLFDEVASEIVTELVRIPYEEGLLETDSFVGVTGRAGITGDKPHIISEKLDRENLGEDYLFVEDGLPLGANTMARCYHELCSYCFSNFVPFSGPACLERRRK